MGNAAYANVTNIVHESETQRQYVRVQIPGTAKINGKNYKIKNISSGGFCLRTSSDFYLPQGVQEVKTLFPFENFAFHLNLKAAPVYHNTEENLAGFSFQDMNTKQISVLNHLITSCLAGMIIGEGDIINIASRNNFTAPREGKINKIGKIKIMFGRILPMALILFAGAMGFFLLFGNIYEKTSIIKSYMGVVEGNIFTVRAQVNGVYQSILPEGTKTVTKDQPLAYLVTESDPASPKFNLTGPTISQKVVINSPCDCLVIERFAQEGEFHALGEPIFELLPQDGRTWITANLKPEQVHRLKPQDDAHIKIAGEDSFIEGNISEFTAPSTDQDIARVKVKTRTPIPPEFIGRLAYIEFVVY